MPGFGALCIFDNFVHNKPIIFVSLVARLFWYLGEFPQKSSDNSRVLYTDLLDSAYLHLFLGYPYR